MAGDEEDKVLRSTAWVRCGFCGIEHKIEAAVIEGKIYFGVDNSCTIVTVQSDSIIEREGEHG